MSTKQKRVAYRGIAGMLVFILYPFLTMLLGAPDLQRSYLPTLVIFLALLAAAPIVLPRVIRESARGLSPDELRLMCVLEGVGLLDVILICIYLATTHDVTGLSSSGLALLVCVFASEFIRAGARLPTQGQ